MIAQELEASLHMAFVEARQKRHEFITVEHLLLALLDNPSSAEVLRACFADIEALRRELQTFISDHTPMVPGNAEISPFPACPVGEYAGRWRRRVRTTSIYNADVVSSPLRPRYLSEARATSAGPPATTAPAGARSGSIPRSI